MKDINATILIVDDEPHDVEFLKRAFQRAGIPNPVQAVGDGEEAVAYLSGAGRFADRAAYPFPRVIMTDLKMPQMNGLELLRWIQTNKKYRVVPTIVVTSSMSQSDVDEAFACGAAGYMVKPVGFAELEKMVKVVTDYWRLSLVPGSDASG